MFWLIFIQKCTLAYSVEEGFCMSPFVFLIPWITPKSSLTTPHSVWGLSPSPISASRNLVPNSVKILCFLQDTVACFSAERIYVGVHTVHSKGVDLERCCLDIQNSKTLPSVFRHLYQGQLVKFLGNCFHDVFLCKYKCDFASHNFRLSQSIGHFPSNFLQNCHNFPVVSYNEVSVW